MLPALNPTQTVSSDGKRSAIREKLSPPVRIKYAEAVSRAERRINEGNDLI
jgi:hypothetical protein